jgi:hypothetical protein
MDVYNFMYHHRTLDNYHLMKQQNDVNGVLSRGQRTNDCCIQRYEIQLFFYTYDERHRFIRNFIPYINPILRYIDLRDVRKQNSFVPEAITWMKQPSFSIIIIIITAWTKSIQSHQEYCISTWNLSTDHIRIAIMQCEMINKFSYSKTSERNHYSLVENHPPLYDSV